MHSTTGLPIEIKLTYLVAILIVFIFAFFIIWAVLAYNKKQQLILAENKAKALELQNYKLNTEIESLKLLQKERERIADDMHDDVGSTIAVIQLLTKNLKASHPQNSIVLDQIIQATTDVHSATKEMIWSLQSQHDDLQKFVIYLRKYAANTLDHQSIALNFKHNITEPTFLDAYTRRQIYLVVKEIINNTVKYSSAANCIISIVKESNIVNLTIANDGLSFDPNTVAKGNGLLNIKKRIAALQGTLELHTTNGVSYTIAIAV